MSELFIEFFSEEIPPNLQISARNQLHKLLVDKLSDANLKYDNFEIYSTPTRIAACISGLPNKIKILPAEIKGPKVGVPEKVLENFAKSRSVDLSELYEKKTEKGKISDAALKLLARASEGSVRDAISLLDRALVFQSLDNNKTIEDSDVRKMLGLADKSKLIHLLNHVFEGDEKRAMELLRELIDNGLDPKNFLNDLLELIYLFGRRINLGPIEKDMLVSEAELELIESGGQNLNMQDLGLFWQLTLKTIEDLKSVSNENKAIKAEPKQ